jgi:hypothetical protein
MQQTLEYCLGDERRVSWQMRFGKDDANSFKRECGDSVGFCLIVSACSYQLLTDAQSACSDAQRPYGLAQLRAYSDCRHREHAQAQALGPGPGPGPWPESRLQGSPDPSICFQTSHTYVT